jgi:hypothetical protein
MNRQEPEKRVKVQCHGLDPVPYECSVIQRLKTFHQAGAANGNSSDCRKNAGKPYSEQIKPYNFLLTAHVGIPEGVDPGHHDSVQRTWLNKEWTDQHRKKLFRITTQGHYGSRRTARVKTYGDVFTE